MNNVIYKYPVCPFRPTFLTLSKGSEIQSAVNQNGSLAIYVHTEDTRLAGEETRMHGVNLALDDDNWEVWEIRVYRAGMATNLPPDTQKLGTVMLREGKCPNHVFAINLGSPKNLRK